MFLRKKHGGCSIGDIEWAEDGAVADVPDELGAELLALAPDEYEHVQDTPAAPEGEVKRPNKAASADEWKAYALAQGLPQEVVDVATRAALIDHFTGGPSLIQE